MELPLISIVLPTYNGSKYIAQSIQSCLQQTYANFELIIVDDCSTDNTPDIIRSYAQKDSRIKAIRNEKNKKLPLSLNTGFEAAGGKYFTWTSDDNYYAPTALAEMAKVLEADEACGLVYADYTTIDDDGKVTGTLAFGNVNDSMVSWKGCGACFLYRAEIHHQLKGYDASAFLIEDYDFFIRALTITRFYYLNRHDLYFYRLHAGSLTSLYGFYNFDLQKIVIERQLPALLRVASKKDQALWFRKFAVYYGVTKNNIKRMEHYLKLLYPISFKQTIITIGYIAVRKLAVFFSISLAAAWILVKLVFRGKK
ncbi:MAG: glycosyltransferase family 2 protein [Niastella sp.]|jgi:glycosyltransferase involved in cell wall biosynthesis|uniref:glycosyltransferase family 2 protein n=1 Tax=Niastella sp. TaxID=1869183 RepID=UPI00389A3693